MKKFLIVAAIVCALFALLSFVLGSWIIGIILLLIGVFFFIRSRQPSKPVEKSVDTIDAPQPVQPSNIDQLLVAGFDHYQDALSTFLNDEAYEWDLSPSEFKESVYGRCYQFLTEFYDPKLVPEPDNEFDPNAIAVYIDDTKIGYVARADQSIVRTAMEKNEEMSCEIFGGKYKEVTENEDGKEIIEKGSTPYKARLIIEH